tara:strand:- start:29 stop:589 length:561 start_codon:yes stop_codon:yes gene_type:complete
MPFADDLKNIKNTHNCQTYLETGLYKCGSLTKALNCGFDKCYSIEIQKIWIDKANKESLKDFSDDKYVLIHDDSANLKKHIVNNPDFEEKRAIFFLDAHVDSGMKEKYQYRCPVIVELEAIKQLKRNDHIICIDDIRIIRHKKPWSESRYDNFYDEMIKQLKLINSNYKIDFLQGIKPNDILIAYL